MSVLDRFRLDGRTAMITGGSRGLGRAMALALAEVGADLILVGREAEALALAKAELTAFGQRVDVVVGDVGTPEGAATACDEVLKLGRAVDVLFNNVGGRRVDVPTEEMPLAQWQAFSGVGHQIGNLPQSHCIRKDSGRFKNSRHQFGLIVDQHQLGLGGI